MELNNCPEEFFKNCRYRSIRCNICAAGKGSSYRVYYQGNTDIGTHPEQIEQEASARARQDARNSLSAENARKSRQVRAGLAKERHLAKILGGKTTVRSGAVYRDGDIELSNGLRLDSKVRNGQDSTRVSAEEWRQLEADNLDGFIITNKLKGGGERVSVVLTLKAFRSLINEEEYE